MIDDMAVYIANLGKYNEGYLVGAWFTFPIDEEDVKEKIGLNEQYEEYAIHDTDNFPIAIGEYVSIEELNRKAELLPKFSAHVMRHTACTRMAECRMDVKVLQYIMGHAHIDVTMEVYNHIGELTRIEKEIARLDSMALNA